MTELIKIAKYPLKDIIRNKWIIIYSLIFLLLTDVLFRFSSDGNKVVLSLMNITLLLVPLISIIFGIIYLHNSREFIELLLSGPLKRRKVFAGIYLGVALPISLAYISGVALPFIYFGSAGFEKVVVLLLSIGVILSLIFLACAFYFAFRFEDKIRSFGFGVLIWLFMAILYDGLILLFIFAFGDYPLEKIVLVLSMLNPIDLSRIIMLMQFDISALMGYTGAVFIDFYGSIAGNLVAVAALVLWVAILFIFGLKKFLKKDF